VSHPNAHGTQTKQNAPRWHPPLGRSNPAGSTVHSAGVWQGGALAGKGGQLRSVHRVRSERREQCRWWVQFGKEGGGSTARSISASRTAAVVRSMQKLGAGSRRQTLCWLVNNCAGVALQDGGLGLDLALNAAAQLGVGR
jgi:hypothetical protein